MGFTTTLPKKHVTVPEGRGFRVKRVPIFAEHERTFNNPVTREPTTVKITKDDLQRFADRMNRRHVEDGWLASVHPVHNDEANDGTRCAYMANYTVDHAIFQGDYCAVLFVDYIVDESPDMSAQKKLEVIDSFPYRSPEVNFQTGDINSLALLRREAPFFRFPLFQRSGLDARAQGVTAGAGGVAYAACGDEYAVLYRCDDVDYSQFSPDEQKAISKNISTLVKEGYPQDQAVAIAIKKIAPDKAAKYEEDAMEDEMEDKGTAKDAGSDMDAKLNELAQALVPMLVPKLKDAMMRAVGVEAPEEDEMDMSYMDGEEDDMAKKLEDKKMAPVVMSSDREFIRYQAEQDAKYAALKSQFDGAMAQLNKQNERNSLAAAVDWARKETRHYVVPADFDAKVAKYAAIDSRTDNDSSPLVTYVTALRDNAMELPTERVVDVPVSVSSDPDAVSKYSDLGPGALKAARKAVTMYRALPASMAGRFSEDKWVEREMARSGFVK